MLHTKALFLVNDKQSQILKYDILGKQTVCSYQDIHVSFLQIMDDMILISGLDKPIYNGNIHRKIAEPLHKGFIMLKG